MIGIVLAVAVLAMFSANIILARVGVARVAMSIGYTVTLAVNVVFSALVFAVEAVVRDDALQLDMRGVALFAIAGFFTTYLGRWFNFEAIARLGPAKASAFQVSSPLFTFLIALAFLGERLSALALAGMALAIFGLLLVSLSGARTTAGIHPNTRRWQRWLRSGLAIGAASSAAYAVGNVMRGAGVRQWNEPVAGALIGAITGILLHVALTPRRGGMLREMRKAQRAGVAIFAAGGILTITAQMCVIGAMRYAPISVVSLITLCTPLLVFPASYFLLRNEERIDPRAIAGGLLALAGVAMIILHQR